MTSASSEQQQPRRASIAYILRNALSRRPSENLQFSDLQQMATSSGATEEILLRPKLLKQSRTESVSTPPQTPKIQLNGRAAQLLSGGSDSVDCADGKYNDLKDIHTPPVTRRRSVFARLKTVFKSHSLDDADVEENSFEDGKVFSPQKLWF